MNRRNPLKPNNEAGFTEFILVQCVLTSLSKFYEIKAESIVSIKEFLVRNSFEASTRNFLNDLQKPEQYDMISLIITPLSFPNL